MGDMEPIPDRLNELSSVVVDAAVVVHRELGPGLLESIYEACVAKELELRGVPVERQVQVPVVYRGCRLEPALRLDLLIGGSLVVEIKAVEALLPIHSAQLLTYLKLSGHRLGLLINFNVKTIRNGIKRLAL